MELNSTAACFSQRRPWHIAIGLAAGLALATSTAAQSAQESNAVTPAQAAVENDDDAVLSPAEPDVVVVNLPTGMRLPVFKGNFRLTHRFAGNLKRGTFGQQASSLFGIDQGATIGFEYRLAVVRHVQAAFYRSSFDKTIQLHGQYSALRQRGSLPVSATVVGSIEGADNFQEKYAPAIGVVVGRLVGTRAAAYVTPMWVDNTAASVGTSGHDDGHGPSAMPVEPVARRSTTIVGLGARVRVAGTTYLAAEVVPRVAGYAPDELAYGVSIERRVGSHMFSLTFTNTSGTTFAQVARGGAVDTVFLGFNLGRKFY